MDVLGPETPLGMLQPAQPLMHAERYIVAVRGLTDTATSKLLPATPGYAALAALARVSCY